MDIAKNSLNVLYQANSPLAPFRPSTMPAAIRPENAPDKSDPEYNMAVLNPNSFLVYQAERKNKQPGYPVSL